MLAGLAKESELESGGEVLLVQPGILSLQGCCHRVSQARVRYRCAITTHSTWCKRYLWDYKEVICAVVLDLKGLVLTPGTCSSTGAPSNLSLNTYNQCWTVHYT